MKFSVITHKDIQQQGLSKLSGEIMDLYTQVIEAACIKMFYEVVGTREFWMMEKIL